MQICFGMVVELQAILYKVHVVSPLQGEHKSKEHQRKEHRDSAVLGALPLMVASWGMLGVAYYY